MQDAEERYPAVAVALELGVPRVAVAEPAMDNAYQAGPAGASLHRPFGRDRRIVGDRVILSLGDEPARRVPLRDRREGVHPGPERRADGAARALLDLGGHEPGGDSRPGRDRAPYLLGRSGDLDLGRNPASAVGIAMYGHGHLPPSEVTAWGAQPIEPESVMG